MEQYDKQLSVIDKTIQFLSENDRNNAFFLIFKNNLQGCILNIAGGIIFGMVTCINLIRNGFLSAHIFSLSSETGMTIETIIKLTLPHSFELIGFWLSGAIGFYIARSFIRLLRKGEVLSLEFYKRVGICSMVVFFIILSAAYVEAYISVPSI